MNMNTFTQEKQGSSFKLKRKNQTQNMNIPLF